MKSLPLAERTRFMMTLSHPGPIAPAVSPRMDSPHSVPPAPPRAAQIGAISRRRRQPTSRPAPPYSCRSAWMDPPPRRAALEYSSPPTPPRRSPPPPRKRQRVGRLDPIEQARQQSRDSEGDRQPRNHPDGCQPRALQHDHPQHLAARGSSATRMPISCVRCSTA